MDKKDKFNKNKDLADDNSYKNISLNFNSLDDLSGENDNTLSNLFLSLNSDKIKEDVKNNKK